MSSHMVPISSLSSVITPFRYDRFLQDVGLGVECIKMDFRIDYFGIANVSMVIVCGQYRHLHRELLILT
jgi:hypothetical protein